MEKVYCLMFSSYETFSSEGVESIAGVFKETPSKDRLHSFIKDEEIEVKPFERSLDSILDELIKEGIVEFECDIYSSTEIWQIKEVELL